MWPYPTFEDALTDALRLSRAMSYKNALAGLALGGGKSVIIGDPHHDKNEKLLAAFAGHVQRLGGTYHTAEDVGIGLEDVEVLAKHSDYVFGVASKGVSTGDPSPSTARGVFAGIRAAAKHKLGRDTLDGLKVAVQGVGNVGLNLCKHLREAGAELVVSDVNEEAIGRAIEACDVRAVSPQEIYGQEVDVFAPCALGGILDDDTIPQLKAVIISGGANNQLAEPRHGQVLADRGILYAPDYVVNAGGMLNASGDIFQVYDVEQVMERVDSIYDTALKIFQIAEAEGRPTHEVADELAREKIAAGKNSGG
jgi:leucine dehydrogenase